eukprot:scaffold2717_cov73-Skeletonema_marinoi.AAC.4
MHLILVEHQDNERALNALEVDDTTRRKAHARQAEMSSKLKFFKADPIASERQANGVGGGFVLTRLLKTCQDLYSSIA